jgi:hypothetical protein
MGTSKNLFWFLDVPRFCGCRREADIAKVSVESDNGQQGDGRLNFRRARHVIFPLPNSQPLTNDCRPVGTITLSYYTITN